MYHYIPVGHQDQCNINREGLLNLWDSSDIYWQSLRINGMTVESVGRRGLCYLLAESEDNEDYFESLYGESKDHQMTVYC